MFASRSMLHEPGVVFFWRSLLSVRDTVEVLLSASKQLALPGLVVGVEHGSLRLTETATNTNCCIQIDSDYGQVPVTCSVGEAIFFTAAALFEESFFLMTGDGKRIFANVLPISDFVLRHGGEDPSFVYVLGLKIGFFGKHG